MKKLVIAIAVILTAFACSPTYYQYSLERMGSTPIGFDPSGKTICVIADSSNINYGVEFTKKLQQSYGNNAKYFVIQSLKKGETIENTMIAFAIQTTNDAIIAICGDEILFYDTMDRGDKVKKFYKATAEVSAAMFQPEWIQENFYLATFQGRDGWYNASMKMEDRKFQEAIDLWIDELRKTKLPEDRAALEANIATALYLQGNYTTARKWMELSMKTYRLTGYANLKAKLDL